ncbi:MAG TPA: gluconate 2-dehydrogenase subunit 3 family protein [Puia sp.]|nr:gluconate 2-dehydrogenase subunit 3 family protein [Puia sp.]
MNRRRAIKRLSLLAGGIVLSLGGGLVYDLYKTPSLKLLDTYKGLIGDLADTIIPATVDSPGAREAGAGDFIVRMVRDCTNKKSQNHFIDGLRSVPEYTEKKYKRSFGACSLEERTAVLTHFEQSGKPYKGWLGKVDHQLEGDSFFVTLKNYTVLGYCTSKPGATQALSYDYIPGKYVGVVPLAQGQRAWATK